MTDGAAQEIENLLNMNKAAGRGAYIPGTGGNRDGK